MSDRVVYVARQEGRVADVRHRLQRGLLSRQVCRSDEHLCVVSIKYDHLERIR